MATEAEVLSERMLSPKAGLLATVLRFCRDKPLGAAGGVILLLAIMVAILAPWIEPYDPLAADVPARLTGPSFAHWAGTDRLGRDELSRLMEGARVSLLVGVVSTLFGTSIGSMIGILSGYFGRRTDMLIQRFMDMWMAFPGLILAMALMAALGASVVNVIIAITIFGIPAANRIARSVAIAVKEFQFVEAARAVGAKRARIILRHVTPNCLAAYLIMLSSRLGGAILTEASLSFLGLGIPPPFPSWGRSLSESLSYLYSAPWLAIFPGVAISLVVFSANVFGDALRDVWDPRLKQL